MNSNFSIDKAIKRNKIIYAIRDFLNSKGYIEVETPILVDKRVPEKSISLFETEKTDFYGEPKKLYLVPSPEITMKKIIAESGKSIFQISKSFRNCEVYTSNHNHEFTMLECYTVGANYMDSLKIVQELFFALPHNEIIKKQIEIVTMQFLFEKYLKCDLSTILSSPDYYNQLVSVAVKNGFAIKDNKTYSAADVFNLLFISFIEPELKTYGAIAIVDYPQIIATTAKAKKSTPWSERWELYIKGIEIINCYTEENDIVKLSKLFKEEDCENSDTEFIIASSKLEKCSGFALGVDRLISVLFNCKSIEDIMIK